MSFVYVFLGGGIGALLRYLVQLLIPRQLPEGFPVSTLLVNIIGCFVIGFLASNFNKIKASEEVILFVFTGVLGGFTTFSSFGLEFVQLIKNNQTNLAFIYVVLSNFAGLALCALGFYIAK